MNNKRNFNHSGNGSYSTPAPRHADSETRPTSSSNSVDPFLLDFGTSVNVSEDLRHVIGAEVKEIDVSIKKVSNELQQEETKQREQQQTARHALTEMTNLGHAAEAQLESVNVHTTFLHGLENNLRTNLLEQSGSKMNVISPERDGHDKKEVEKAGLTQSWLEIIQDRKAKQQEVRRRIIEAKKEIEENHAKHRNTIQQTEEIEKSIASGNLEQVMESQSREVERFAQEIQQEKEKIQEKKTATTAMRTKGAENAQRISDLIKERDAARQQFEVDKEALLKKIPDPEKLVEERRAELTNLKDQLSQALAKLEAIKKEDALKKKLVEVKAELEIQREKEKELSTIKSALDRELAERSNDLELSEVALQEVTDLMSEANKKKAENEEKYNDIVVPGRVELSEIAEQKERLAKSIEETQKSNTELEIGEREHLDSKLKIKKQVLEELSEMKEKVDGAVAKRKALEESNRQARRTWENEIEECKTLEKKFRDAAEANEAHTKSMRQARDQRHQESMAEARKKLDQEEAANDLVHKFFRDAEALMEKAQKRVAPLGTTLDL